MAQFVRAFPAHTVAPRDGAPDDHDHDHDHGHDPGDIGSDADHDGRLPGGGPVG